MSRLIIFTGKGGVGKSSVAAAHAVQSAAQGKKTLLVSTDMAHNIADIFQKPVGSRITPLLENLYGYEPDYEQLIREEFQETNRALYGMVSEAGSAVSNAGEDMLMPGFDELFGLLKIGRLYESGEWDRILVDCAPTGETLTLLKLPELLSWYIEKFFPVGKAMIRVLRPISKARYQVELPSGEQLDSIARLHADLLHLQKLLRDDEGCSVRLVCTPEKMVVEETKRSYMYLNLYGYRVDGLFINRVLPECADAAFFSRWHELQKTCIKELENVFADLPIRRIPWYPEELRGTDALQRLCADVLTEENGQDVFAVRAQGGREVYEETQDGWCLRVRMPGAAAEDLTVFGSGMDLDIECHNFTRRIPLPDTLRGAKIAQVRMEGDEVLITFTNPSKEAGS